MNRARAVLTSLAALLLPIIVAAGAVAQDFPTKPIRIIVPWAPGGNVDITARTIAPGLGEALGTSVIVENKPGAGGTLGTAQVAKSAPDGYTLTVGSTAAVTIAPSVYKGVDYDPIKDLVAIGPINNSALVLTASPKLPVSNYKEFIAEATKRGGQLSVGTPGLGSTNHLTIALVEDLAGIKILHVPYKGAGPALNDLLANQLDMMVDQLPPSMPHIREGRIKAIAVSSLKRIKDLPDVPTFDELGLKGFQANTFTGLFGPAGIPQPVVDKLSAALAKVLATPVVRERFLATGVDMLDLDRAEFAAFVKADFEKWLKVVRAANIAAE